MLHLVIETSLIGWLIALSNQPKWLREALIFPILWLRVYINIDDSIPNKYLIDCWGNIDKIDDL